MHQHENEEIIEAGMIILPDHFSFLTQSYLKRVVLKTGYAANTQKVNRIG